MQLETPSTDADWHAIRQTGLGSSDAAVLLGLSPWKSPFVLYAEKLGLAEPSVEESEAMWWGTALEPVLCQRFERETSRAVERNVARHVARSSDHPWQIATVDAWQEAHDHPGQGVLELKTTNAFRLHDWDEEPPLLYQVQLQHQLAVTGCQWGSIAVLVGGQKFLWQDMKAHPEFQAMLFEEEAQFWRRLQEKQPPSPDGSDATKMLLQTLWKTTHAGEEVALPAEADVWDRKRTDAILAAKVAEDERQKYENLLKATIGPAQFGKTPAGILYSWKEQTRKEHLVPEATFRVFRRSEKKQKGTS